MSNNMIMLSCSTLFLIATLNVVALQAQANKDRLTCSDGVPPPIIYAMPSSINYYRNGASRELLSSPGVRTVALDYWHEGKVLVWSDVSHDHMCVCRVRPNETLPDGLGTCVSPGADLTVVDEQTEVTDGIAIDWVHALLFRADAHNDKLYVMDLQTMQERVLVDSGLRDPRGLAVDPAMGLIFWTDWGENRIERVGMDGANRATVSTGYKDYQIKWPNGLALDHAERRVYFAEAFSGSQGIYSTDYWGEDFKAVLQAKEVSHPFSLAVSEQWLFWTDWRNKSIFASGRCSGKIIRLETLTDNPMTVRVFDPSTQPPSENVCRNHKCRSGEICLPKARLRCEIIGQNGERPPIRLYTCMTENGTLVDPAEAAELRSGPASDEGSQSSGTLAFLLGCFFGCLLTSAVIAFCVFRKPEWIRWLQTTSGLLFGANAKNDAAYAGFDNVVLNLSDRPN